MARQLSAYYGRTTVARLDCCAHCGKRYDDSDDWHTLMSTVGNIDFWFIACHECSLEHGNAMKLRGDTE